MQNKFNKKKSQNKKIIENNNQNSEKLSKEEIEKWKNKLVVNSKGKLRFFIIVGVCALGIAGCVGGHYAYKYVKQQEIEKNRCIITFDTSDGKTVKVQKNKGDKIQEPTVPTKENYTFGGWFFDKEFKNKCTFPFVANESITLYAKWRVTITFDNGDGKTISSQIIDIGETASIPDIPTQTGKKFAGWFFSKDYTNRFYFTETFDKNTKVYAKWVDESEYNVVTFACGNNYSYQQEVKKFETIKQPTIPSYKDYTFKGWFTDVACKTNWDFNNVVPNDMNLYGLWNKDGKIMVTYYRSSTEFETRDIQVGTRAENIIPTKKPGYKFAYWCTDSAFQNKFDFNTKLNESIILYAKWVEEDWLVTKEQFNESFSYLVDVEGRTKKELNYSSSEGRLQIIENDKTLYDIVNFTIADDKEFFVNEKSTSEQEYFYSQKQNDYYAYVKAESKTPSIGTFSYFDNYAIRDYIGEVFQTIYDKFEYFSISDNDKGYIYNFGKEGEEYNIHILLTFANSGNEKRIDKFDCEYTHIDQTTKNTKTIWSHQQYVYGGMHVSMPDGNWKTEMAEYTHEFTNDPMVTNNPVKTNGTHVLSILSSPANLDTITAKQKGSGQDLVEVDFPVKKDNIVIHVGGNRLASDKYEIKSVGGKNKLVLADKTIASQKINILLDIKNIITSDMYFYFN